ncbi:unnamed protein product [Ectocarpus sp. 6 AP-2014]
MSANSTKTVLVAGGAGYIGSHTVVLLLEAGYNVVVADNLCNSSEESLRRVRVLTGCAPERLVFHNVDLCDAAALGKVLEACPQFHSCIHFAGLKAVGESVALPLLYYQNNIMSTLVLLEELGKTTCRNFVFSSSATVYGTSPSPITESSKVGDGITNPYGRTKFMIEEILKDFVKSDKGKDWAIDCLRYFNPTGAHSSGDIGEDPNGIPNNLMPYVAQVAVGKRECLTVFGDKYDTKDGTGVRDYIHVVDLASGHLKALDFLEKKGCGWYTHNLGTGTGYSVLEMVEAMKKASGKDIPYKVGAPRVGDLACVYADPAKAAEDLGWKAQFGLDEMMRDMWAWQSKNPNGFSA